MAAKSDVFEYTFDGKKITLPLLSKLKFGLIRKMRKESAEEQMFMLVEQLADDETLAVIDEMDSGQVAEFMEAWQEASDVDSGESGK